MAYDDQEREVGRAQQRVNVPRPRAAAHPALLESEPGAVQRAHLTWETAEPIEPKTIRLALAGVPLQFEEPDSIVLPPRDPNQEHLLSAELLFPGDLRAQTAIGIDGHLERQVDSGLTAVSVLRPEGGKEKLPTKEEMSDWFLINGQRVEIFAVEKTPADLVVVVDEEARPVVSVYQAFFP